LGKISLLKIMPGKILKFLKSFYNKNFRYLSYLGIKIEVFFCIKIAWDNNLGKIFNFAGF
jgi:hypothetical protein